MSALLKRLAPLWLTLWAGRNRREQILLAVLGGLLGVVLLVYGLVLPLIHAEDNARRHYERSATDLAEAQRLAAGIKAASGRSEAMDAEALRKLVEATAAEGGVTVANFDHDADGNLKLVAQGLSSLVFFRWLLSLEHDHGVRIVALSATKADDGALNVDLTLSGGAV